MSDNSPDSNKIYILQSKKSGRGLCKPYICAFARMIEQAEDSLEESQSIRTCAAPSAMVEI